MRPLSPTAASGGNSQRSVFFSITIIIILYLSFDPTFRPTILLSFSLSPSMLSSHSSPKSTNTHKSSTSEIKKETPSYGVEQCGRNFVDSFGTINQLPLCNDTLSSLHYGYRESYNGPFFPYNIYKQEICNYQWYDSAQICDILQASNRLLIFIGDSLLRHIHQSLYILISDNYRNGAVMTDLITDNDLKLGCQCDTQYNDQKFEAQCRKYTYANYQGEQQRFCPSWNNQYIVPSLDWYNGQIFKENEEYFTNILLQRIKIEFFNKAIIFLNIGLHNELLPDFVFPIVHQRIFQLLKEAELDKTVHVLCITVNTPQDNQPDEYKIRQGPKLNQQYNTELHKLCESYPNGRVFDISQITNNTVSHDGVHSSMDINLAITQILVNYIVELDQLTPFQQLQ